MTRRRSAPAVLATVLVPLLALAAAPAAGPGAVDAQEAPPDVGLRGASDVAVDRRLARLLRSDPLIVTRDTLIARGDTVSRPVLALGEIRVIVEGVLLDDLVGIRTSTWIRDGAVVRGDVVNLNGGLYLSQIATIRGTIIDEPSAPYQVVEEEGQLVIVGSGAPSPLQLDGFSGLRPPTYDRANGLTLSAGATLWLPMLGDVQPYVRGHGGWRTEPGEPVFGGEAGLRVGAYTLAGGYARGSATNDQWIRADLMNSLNYLLSGKDYRDYHDVERRWAGLWREFGDAEKSFEGLLGVRLQAEDARSMAAGEPWHIFGDSVRPNPAIDEGRITSAVAEVSFEWRGRETAADGTLAYEHALDALDGQFTFRRVTVDADWAVHAFANHTVEIELHAQAPLGGDPLPRQRWGFVGGSGTIQTLDFAEFYGDRVVFVETKYIVPMPQRLALPVLGAPDLQLVHGAGMAWTAGETRDLRQEIGARVEFFSLYFRYMLEPSDPSNADLDIGLSWPFGDRYPWQR